MILVVAEQRGGRLNRASWEAIAAAQQVAPGELPTVALLGSNVERQAAELAAARVREVVRIEHPALEHYTPDGFTAALQTVLEPLAPELVIFPHTYQTRDLAPKLAARLDRALITDVIGIRTDEQRRTFLRPMFQGKLTAEVRPEGPTPHFVSIQIGAYRADQAARGDAAAPVRSLALVIESKEEDPSWIPPDWHFVEMARKRGLGIVRLTRIICFSSEGLIGLVQPRMSVHTARKSQDPGQPL